MERVCVYAGSSPGSLPAYAEAARTLARTLVARGTGIVYGGGSVGLMGVLADEALAAGGEVVGVLPRKLRDREVGHDGLTELHVVETMHQRKAMMADLADGFVALPGGVGTLEELVEATTWTQLRYHTKPVGLLDAEGFWRPLAALLDHMVAQSFLRSEHRHDLLFDDDPARLLDRLDAWQPKAVEKWLDAGDLG